MNPFRIESHSGTPTGTLIIEVSALRARRRDIHVADSPLGSLVVACDWPHRCLSCFGASSAGPDTINLNSGWQYRMCKVPQSGCRSLRRPIRSGRAGMQQSFRHRAHKPGDDNVYPEPLYGENNVPKSFLKASREPPYWYRTVVEILEVLQESPHLAQLDGINYSSTVWVNGAQVGTTRGAFMRGIFDSLPA